ncbi:hypothetical protein A3Q56_07805, partial [Intoshia linei]
MELLVKNNCVCCQSSKPVEINHLDYNISGTTL